MSRLLLVAVVVLFASCSGADPSPTCGNGLVEANEACDGGPSCNSRCQFIVGNPTDPAR